MKTNLLLTAALSLSLCAASTAQTLPAYLPTDGLVGWWPFNGNANDESGNGNNGVVNGATLTEDRFGDNGKAYNFQGTNDQIEINTTSGIFDIFNFSVSFWLRTDQTGGNPALISRTNQSGSVYDNFVLFEDYGKLALNGGSVWTSGYATTSQNTILGNTWKHIVAVSTPTTATVYVNGIVAKTDTSAISYFMNFANYPMRFGRSYHPYWADYSGELDDIAFYNRALTPEEITALYTGEPVNPPTTCNPLPANLQNGLVGYWPFCGNANDESGNGNDGTVNGATLTEDRFGVANAAYSFDGVDDFCNLNTINPDDFSVSLWVKVDSFRVYNNFLGSEILSTFNQNFGVSGFVIRTDNTPNKIVSGFWNTTGDQIVSRENIDQINWQHYLVSYSNQKLKLYYNGSLTDSTNGDYVQNNQNIFLGCRQIYQNNSPGIFFEGKIDDIGIWNRALSPEEVQQLYTLNACTFTIYDTTNVTIYDTVSVSVSTTDTLIINTLITAVEPAQENTFLVYPNPASTQITINNGNVSILGGYTMRISNSLGQDVYNQNITQPQVTLDLSTWGGNGLYVLYIVDPQQNIVAVKQIVLQ